MILSCWGVPIYHIMNEWTNEWECMNEWITKWVNEWTNERTNECMHLHIYASPSSPNLPNLRQSMPAFAVLTNYSTRNSWRSLLHPIWTIPFARPFRWVTWRAHPSGRGSERAVDPRSWRGRGRHSLDSWRRSGSRRSHHHLRQRCFVEQHDIWPMWSRSPKKRGVAA